MIFWKQNVRMQLHKPLNAKGLAPRARFELATLRLTAEMIENLSALSGVAYEKLGASFPSLVAPASAPTAMTFEWWSLERNQVRRGEFGREIPGNCAIGFGQA